MTSGALRVQAGEAKLRRPDARATRHVTFHVTSRDGISGPAAAASHASHVAFFPAAPGRRSANKRLSRRAARRPTTARPPGRRQAARPPGQKLKKPHQPKARRQAQPSPSPLQPTAQPAAAQPSPAQPSQKPTQSPQRHQTEPDRERERERRERKAREREKGRERKGERREWTRRCVELLPHSRRGEGEGERGEEEARRR